MLTHLEADCILAGKPDRTQSNIECNDIKSSDNVL